VSNLLSRHNQNSIIISVNYILVLFSEAANPFFRRLSFVSGDDLQPLLKRLIFSKRVCGVSATICGGGVENLIIILRATPLPHYGRIIIRGEERC